MTDKNKEKEKEKKVVRKEEKPNAFMRATDAVRRYLRESVGELKKVHWPTRKEAYNLTLIVLAVIVAMTIFLGGLDFLFTLGFAQLLK